MARTVTVRGSLQPHHRKGDRSVLVRFYHREGGQWVLRRGLTAVNRDYVDYTRYSVTVRLPSNGTWRVRVQHSDSDHAFTSQYSASFRVP